MEFLLFVFAFGIVAYFFPTFIAHGRKHPATFLIFVVNLALGWTVLGWIFCLVWAFAEPDRSHYSRA